MVIPEVSTLTERFSLSRLKNSVEEKDLMSVLAMNKVAQSISTCMRTAKSMMMSLRT